MEYNIKPMNFEADKDGNLSDVPEMIDRVIEKRGHVVEFTMSQLEQAIKYNKKTKVELDGQIKLDSAKLENIESFHEFVKEMSEEDLFTVWMYQEQKTKVSGYTDKLEEVVKMIKENEEEAVAIKSQIAELNIESPYDSTAGEDK